MLSAVLLLTLFINNLVSNSASFGFLILISFFLIFIWVWMFFGELRTKVIHIDLQQDSVKIRRYLGLGVAKTYYFGDITGFKTSILSSKSGSFEYLYLITDNRKIAKLSGFYHSNYQELKQYIVSRNIKNIGFESFSNLQELRDIFSR